MEHIGRLDYGDLTSVIEIDIFGIEFSIKVNDEYIKNLKESKIDEKGGSTEEIMDLLLGTGAYKKIKDKYERDLGKEITDTVWVKVILFLQEQIEKYFNNYGKNFESMTRTPRRRTNRYSRNYRRYRRY
ncbi:MAG: hypothetical protein PUE33_04790 [bacterium]|nr:hypothetical protein [bacterium]